MTPPNTKLVKRYLAAVLIVVLFVPWTDPVHHVRSYGYSFVFFPPNRASVIDYGKIVLELIAITCIAGLVWLFKERSAAGELNKSDNP